MAENWGEDFATLRRHLEAAVRASHQLADWMSSQLGSGDPSSDVSVLKEATLKAQSLANQLSDRFHRRPLDLLLRGLPMAREEFYLLVAMGAVYSGAYTRDAYADFQMLRYEDDDHQCYIWLHERPPAGRIALHVGMFPEEISWDRLRSEQQRFFEQYLPAVAARFQRNQ